MTGSGDRVLSVALAGLAAAGLPAGAVEYLRDIKPVLEERCYACHGALKQKSGLRLDTAVAVRKGGEEGEVVVPGDPEGSELMARLTHPDEGERMPPEGKALTSEQIAAIREWIAAGAPVPAEESGQKSPREHWAFQRIERPEVPAGSAAHPIDRFLDAKRAEQGLVAQREAERAVLLRRLHLDLTGLPPTRAQLRDERRIEEIADELLESPLHAERWARHWMDVWRYSDWYGLDAQLRYSQKHMWRWRDWIVEALREDKGYDRMIHEMLAGDELAPEDPDTVRATGYLARNYYLFNRTTWLDSTIEHTGKAFLGLTLDCAKCHDHKYDPIEMTDYYRFRAIFEPHQARLDPVPGATDVENDGLPRVFDNHLEAPTWLHRRGDPKDPDQERPIEPGVPVLFADFAPEIEAVELPLSAWAPGTRSYVQEDRRREARAAVEEARKAFEVAEAAERTREAADRTEADEPELLIADEFDRPDSEVWDIAGDDWAYRDGKLCKTTADRENEVVQTREPHPRDFEVTCRYTVTSGTTYKSVGVRFDRIDGGAQQHQVYTSAHEPGPKVQVSHTVDGNDSYPANGGVAKPIMVGQAYELKFAVRERLLNVWLDGEFVLAYELPQRHSGGRLALSGFDAVVEFESLTLRELPGEVVLRPVADGPLLSTPELARARVEAAEAELAWVEATVAADRARGSERFEELARAAVVRKAERRVAKARAEVVGEEDAEKRKTAEARLAEAEKELAEAKDGGGEFETFRASRKALETPEHKEPDYPATWPRTSSGRRTALAKWMTSRENPLTARVAVNHVWMRHFGEPLVETVFDFGLRAERPEHAELLDFLAVEFIESGWSFRHLHRLMVTSRAYRLSSSTAGADEKMRQADAGNRFYWRMNARRMEAEVLRDSLLHLAGTLDMARGGPSIDPKQGGTRRSLYFKHSRDDQDGFLTKFDHADHLMCYRRSESIVPQQALALSNSRLALEMAEQIARRLESEADEREAFIGVAFETILGRAPDDDERAACREFCDKLREVTQSPEPEATARTRLVHALLNHNDFVTIR